MKSYMCCSSSYVTAGVNMRAYGGTRIVKQFSGNFWWATAEYYAHLEASQPMAKDYLGATAASAMLSLAPDPESPAPARPMVPKAATHVCNPCKNLRGLWTGLRSKSVTVLKCRSSPSSASAAVYLSRGQVSLVDGTVRCQSILQSGQPSALTQALMLAV